MTHAFEAGKTYQTRDGRDARIYATDGGGTSTIHGAIRDSSNNGWNMGLWSESGQWVGGCRDHPGDLMPPKELVWVALWRHPDGGLTAHCFYDAVTAAARPGSPFSNHRRVKTIGPFDVEDEP